MFLIRFNPNHTLAFYYEVQLRQKHARPTILPLSVALTTLARQNIRGAHAFLAFELLTTNPNVGFGFNNKILSILHSSSFQELIHLAKHHSESTQR